jgi:23S rRNA pseudouridine1911/1915/1917 synthase
MRISLPPDAAHWDAPAVIYESASYAAVYKPPCMHTVPLSGDPAAPEGTLLDWFAAMRPQALSPRGRHPWEGGVLHRLDYETRGITLIATTQSAFDDLSRQQERGLFAKTYAAVSEGRAGFLPMGFPPCPRAGSSPPLIIESAFRPFGPGRKAVRPALPPYPKHKDIAFDRGGYYKTEVTEVREEPISSKNDDRSIQKIQKTFTIRIMRGFRHHIRCHLAWIGFPILNDVLYGGFPRPFPGIALTATDLSFNDPDAK